MANQEKKGKYPEPTVGALIFNQKGEIFLMKSHKFSNRYVIPGGHIELGEKIEDTLRREVKEETGLNVYDIKFIDFQECIFDKIFWKKKHFIFLDFSCKTNSIDVKLNSEAQDYVWVNIKRALKLKLDPYTRQVIKEYIKQKCKQKTSNR